MEALLFLAHRLPYPPSKGDKVRSYHFLEHLARRYRIFLGSFVDDPHDWRHVAALEARFAGVHVEPLVPWTKRLASTHALFGAQALSLPYFRSRRLARWVTETVRREGVTRAFVYSSPMAQYVLGLPGVRSTVDFVDMDSAKWGEYAQRRPWPARALYRREAARLLTYEREVAAKAERSLFVTDAETQGFVAKAPECAPRVVAIPNGVDGEHFSPSHALASPFAPAEKAVVFTGAMDYWPNVDAVTWFARAVLPELRRDDWSIRFYVVGMNPGRAVRALAADGATTVTGRVDDVRPYLRHAGAVVAPLRVARGIQNKVLEAMAMAKPVVLSAGAAAGLAVEPGVHVEAASGASEFADKVRKVLDPAYGMALGLRARARVLEEYAWAASFRRLDEVLESESARLGETLTRPRAGPGRAPMGTAPAR